MKTAVSTRAFDNTRQNANLTEEVLTQNGIRTKGIRLLNTVKMSGDARGTEATTLIAPDIKTMDGSTRDLMIHGTMGNYVFCHDANDATLIWSQRVGTPIRGSKQIDAYQINDNWGVLSTGALDLDAKAYGCVSWSSPDGSVAKGAFFFHWMSIVDGAHIAPPIPFEGVTYDPGNGLPLQKFASAARKQRSSLLLTNVNGVKTVFVAFGSVSESSAASRGWVIAFDVTTKNVKLSAAWSTTSRYSGAGIWMGGQGPAAVDNKLYLMTGNGAFSPPTDFGECMLELTYTPPVGPAQGKLVCTDWFAPFSDAGKAGQDPTWPDIKGPDEGGASNQNEWTDMDLGSGGLGVNPELGYAVGAGKDGIGYVLRLDNFGKTKNADFAPSKIQGNYAKAAYIGWLTFFPGFNVSPEPTDLTATNRLYDGKTHHHHSTPVQYKSSVYGWMLFCWGENAALRAWQIKPDGSLFFLASSDETASPNTGGEGGMPGGLLSLSANGTKAGTAVLWASVPWGDANKTITQGRLIAYDAEHFTRRADGSLRIMPIWNSSDWGLNFTHNKFLPPTPVNGKVYLADYSGNILVWG